MMELFPKISVIGCGNVGMRYVYALMIKGTARKIVLVTLIRKNLVEMYWIYLMALPSHHQLKLSQGTILI